MSVSDDETTSTSNDDDDDLHDDHDLPDPEIQDAPDAALLPPGEEEDVLEDDDSEPPPADDNGEYIPIPNATEGPPAATAGCEGDDSSETTLLEPPPTEHDHFKATEEAGRAAGDLQVGERRVSSRKKTSTHDPAFQYLLVDLLGCHGHHYSFLTEQMSAKKEL